ncbi:hypothetical protein EAI_10420, partial [Harpegnathos saltator]
RFNDLIALLDKYPGLPAFICLSETWLKDTDRMNLNNYILITNNREGPGGGAAIAVRLDINFVVSHTALGEELLSRHNMNFCCIEFNINQIPHQLISVYNPPNNTLVDNDPPFWDNFFAKFKSTYNLIITGDFNYRHPL